ncbi:GGDEF domain-containing protein [Shewanella dokdonensis]|uniref:GGDEF domain-containing protein n=1 Tax=Shewanella dokdonensis TaxID=712036 RepID=A0ABX8DH51_9GAMM|nr:GGDEF domain-containing protein [Shewanella dokdonensis]MCL1074317.1 GGDEF domain-containing protein [Shewanella dokdonensis]QVK24010.1 GGDEF domain-containing protein [Shewanella dokdonensis]
MLPESVKPGISLLENDNHGLNLVRWMHQCELMKHYYQADKVFVLQKTDTGYEVIVSAADNSMQFAPGKTFDAEATLLQRMVYSTPDGLNLDLTQGTSDEYPDEFRSVLCILSRPVHWPDGSVFGCLCVLNAHANENQHVSPLMLEPFQILLQQDLTLLCQNYRIEALSMRDANTGMLNHYGFIMMAPRQLNLGRRFGAHCGVIFFELEPTGDFDDEMLKRCHQELANLLLTTLRAADIAAHYDNTKFVLLVFVDLERDLEHIVRRVERIFGQSPLPMSLDYSYRFFTPDSTAKLVAMVDEAKSGLRSSLPKRDD